MRFWKRYAYKFGGVQLGRKFARRHGRSGSQWLLQRFFGFCSGSVSGLHVLLCITVARMLDCLDGKG
jgi:hypothetical protein